MEMCTHSVPKGNFIYGTVETNTLMCVTFHFNIKYSEIEQEGLYEVKAKQTPQRPVV